MRYHSRPKFDSRHWDHLWKANIPSCQSLKEASASTTFVAIDAEPWRLEGLEIAAIGITINKPVDDKANSIRPTSLESLLDNFALHFHCIRVAKREHRPTRRDELF